VTVGLRELDPATAEAPSAEAQPDRPARARTVVYITGYGRSGSTILDILLGNAPGVESVGELDLLHRDWNERCCSCGARYDDCSFWSEAWRRVVERVGHRAHEELERNLRRVERVSSLPALALGLLPASWKGAYREQTLAELDAISASRGREIVLDSSKSAREAAGRALALERITGVRVKRIHLVRDGRAVVWSVKRGDNVRLAAGKEGEEASFAFATARAIFGWILGNTVAILDALLAEPGSSIVVRYEDLVARPDEELERIGRHLGVDLSEVRRRVREGELLEVGHSTGGNRVRRAGVVRIQSDREWEAKLPRRDRAAFWAFAWPLALRFGYRPARRS
jgi:hypothetical protein